MLTSAAGIICLIMSIFALALPSHATVVPHSLFSDNAVLQQGVRIPVWGTADEGEIITVCIQDQCASTQTRRGRWIVWLEALKPGGPFKMTISGKDSVEINDILVGEVWICSGQSNMRWRVAHSETPEEVIAASRDPMLRLLDVPQTDRPPKRFEVSWQECGPTTVGDFSAVGYHFARELRKALNVPVGIICSAVGGTPAEAWTSRRALAGDPSLRSLLNEPRTGTSRPACLYNGMIAPIQPYAIRGVIWYQGESNAGRACQYRTLFPTMIRSWREAWGQGDFPFLFVQLAPYGNDEPDSQSSPWAELREAQLLTVRSVHNAGMAVITDLGDPTDIHPKPKRPVGERLALAARAIAYGEKIPYSGPIFRSLTIEGVRALLSFDHVCGGLEARGSALTGFAIAGDDQKFYPAQADIVGDRVAVWSPQVPKPVAVRYGWANFPVVNLYNKAGLPASPFRTDDFPMVTDPNQPSLTASVWIVLYSEAKQNARL